jgi:hypothetical protein
VLLPSFLCLLESCNCTILKGAGGQGVSLILSESNWVWNLPLTDSWDQICWTLCTFEKKKQDYRSKDNTHDFAPAHNPISTRVLSFKGSPWLDSVHFSWPHRLARQNRLGLVICEASELISQQSGIVN